MRVGYFATGVGPHLDIAKHLIASCQKHMPGVEICQLTDLTTPCLPGAKAIRSAGKVPMGIRRIKHYSKCEGDWLFLDTDVVFLKDVREVFDRVFDVALCDRVGTYMEGTQYAQQQPYNFGVVFSRCPKYWEYLLPHMKKLSPELQRWGGEQILTCELANQALSEFSVCILPSKYNFTPEKRGEDVSHASIIHGKGARKAWLADYA